MPLEIIILAVRVAIALSLYAFLGALFILIWQDVRTASERSPESRRSSGRLIVVACEDVPLEVGHVFPLRPVTTLGRGPTNTIVLPDEFASAEHAQIILRKGQWWLMDQQSRNGTTVNEVPVTGAVVLSSGDVIGIGRIKLRLEIGNYPAKHTKELRQ
jgi:hypothetical protein